MKSHMFVLLAVIVALFPSLAFGQEGNNSLLTVISKPFSELSTNASLTYVSAYVGSTTGAPFSKKPCVQLNLNVAAPNGVYVNLWQSLPADGRNSHSFARETDYGIGYNKAIGKLNVDVSGTLYDLVPTSDLYAVTLVTSYQITKSHQVYSLIEHDFAAGSTLLPGTSYKVGVRGPVAKSPVSLDLAILGNCGPAPYGAHQDTIDGYRAQISYNFKLCGLNATAAETAYRRVGNKSGLCQNNNVFSLAVSKSL